MASLPEPGPGVTVVLPVFRTRDALPQLYRRLARVLEGLGETFELVFVDDACPQGSFAVLDRLAAEDPRSVAVRLAENAGQHRAVLMGLAEARGRRVVVMDSDLQDPPEAIPLLLSDLDRGGAAAVFAGRRGRYESMFRLLTSRTFKGALHLVTGLPRDAGLFVAMDRRMRDSLLAFEVDRPFVVAMMGVTGLPTRSVPVTRMPRPSGGSSYSSRTRLATGLRALSWAACRRLGIPPRAPRRPFPVVAARAGPGASDPVDAAAGASR